MLSNNGNNGNNAGGNKMDDYGLSGMCEVEKIHKRMGWARIKETFKNEIRKMLFKLPNWIIYLTLYQWNGYTVSSISQSSNIGFSIFSFSLPALVRDFPFPPRSIPSISIIAQHYWYSRYRMYSSRNDNRRRNLCGINVLYTRIPIYIVIWAERSIHDSFDRPIYVQLFYQMYASVWLFTYWCIRERSTSSNKNLIIFLRAFVRGHFLLVDKATMHNTLTMVLDSRHGHPIIFTGCRSTEAMKLFFLRPAYFKRNYAHLIVKRATECGDARKYLGKPTQQIGIVDTCWNCSV